MTSIRGSVYYVQICIRLWAVYILMENKDKETKLIYINGLTKGKSY